MKPNFCQKNAKLICLPIWILAASGLNSNLIQEVVYQDLWGISANLNNLFGLFATHFFTNSTSESSSSSTISIGCTAIPEKNGEKKWKQFWILRHVFVNSYIFLNKNISPLASYVPADLLTCKTDLWTLSWPVWNQGEQSESALKIGKFQKQSFLPFSSSKNWMIFFSNFALAFKMGKIQKK